MARSPAKTIQFHLLFTISWLVWAGLHAYVLTLFNFDWYTALQDSLISNLLMAGVCLLVMTTLQFYLPLKNRYSYILILCFALTALWLIVNRTISLRVIDTPGYTAFFILSIPIRIAVAFLIIGCMTLVSVLWYTIQDQQKTERRKAEAENLSKEAELFKLRQQLQPHFLFNSLNSISSLVSNYPGKARTMIQQLSDFLRGNLRKEEQQLVPLQEEIANLQLYLDIEGVRFGHRLQTSILIDEGAGSFLLPPLLLQPVVENAIKFGLYDTTDTVLISLHACIENEQLIIIVTNPFDPQISGAAKGTGFGLSSIQRRLFLLYARKDLLQINAEANLFTTRLVVPKLT